MKWNKTDTLVFVIFALGVCLLAAGLVLGGGSCS